MPILGFTYSTPLAKISPIGYCVSRASLLVTVDIGCLTNSVTEAGINDCVDLSNLGLSAGMRIAGALSNSVLEARYRLLFAGSNCSFDALYLVPLEVSKSIALAVYNCVLLISNAFLDAGIVEELLWFLRGSVNSKELEAKGVNIWKGNSSRDFLDANGFFNYDEGIKIIRPYHTAKKKVLTMVYMFIIEFIIKNFNIS